MKYSLDELKGRRESDRVSDVVADSFTNFPNNFIGLSLSNEITFLIDCPPFWSQLLASHIANSHYSFESFRVKYLEKPRVQSKLAEDLERSFISITLASSDQEVVDYYSSVIRVFIGRCFGMDVDNVILELDRLVGLFRLASSVGRGSVQGLWAELFCLLLGKDTSKGISGWKQSPNSRFDLIDPNWCLEVKSTLRTDRIHMFSNHQIGSRNRKKTYVLSIMLLDSSSGLSVLDLQQAIESKLGHESFDLRQRIAKTLGKDVLVASRYRFDWHYAKENWLLFEGETIPRLHPESERIISYKFDVKLDGLESVPVEDLGMLF